VSYRHRAGTDADALIVRGAAPEPQPAATLRLPNEAPVFGRDEQVAVALDDELLPHVPVDVHASTLDVSRSPYIGAMPYFLLVSTLRSRGAATAGP
jgi:hypothetical protein